MKFVPELTFEALVLKEVWDELKLGLLGVDFTEVCSSEGPAVIALGFKKSFAKSIKC